MTDRKPRARREVAEQEASSHYPHHPAEQGPPPPHYYQSAPPPPHMAAYASYPTRQQYAHSYAAWQPGMRGDPASSPPAEGFHPPPYHRYPPRRNPTAVTPEQGHLAPPAEFMSPPSNVKRRPFASGSSLSPSKRLRTGTFLAHGVRSLRCFHSLGCNSRSPLSHRIASICPCMYGFILAKVPYVLKFGRVTCLSD
jgi:hypothetical protein